MIIQKKYISIKRSIKKRSLFFQKRRVCVKKSKRALIKNILKRRLDTYYENYFYHIKRGIPSISNKKRNRKKCSISKCKIKINKQSDTLYKRRESKLRFYDLFNKLQFIHPSRKINHFISQYIRDTYFINTLFMKKKYKKYIMIQRVMDPTYICHKITLNKIKYICFYLVYKKNSINHGYLFIGCDKRDEIAYILDLCNICNLYNLCNKKREEMYLYIHDLLKKEKIKIIKNVNKKL